MNIFNCWLKDGSWFQQNKAILWIVPWILVNFKTQVEECRPPMCSDMTAYCGREDEFLFSLFFNFLQFLGWNPGLHSYQEFFLAWTSSQASQKGTDRFSLVTHSEQEYWKYWHNLCYCVFESKVFKYIYWEWCRFFFSQI